MGEGASRTPRAYVADESEREVVPMNDSNKDGTPPAESREGSNRAKENVQRPRTGRAQQRAAVSQGLEGVRQAARHKATGKFTSLLHHLTPQLLRGIGSCGTRLRRRVQPPDAENRTSGGVGEFRGAIPGTQPDRKGRHVSYVRGRLPQATPGKRSGVIRL